MRVEEVELKGSRAAAGSRHREQGLYQDIQRRESRNINHPKSGNHRSMTSMGTKKAIL